MAAHAASTAPAPLLPTPTRGTVRRSGVRRLPWLGAVTVLVLLAMNASAVQATAHATCTWGTEPGTTCGEALYLLGFPV